MGEAESWSAPLVPAYLLHQPAARGVQRSAACRKGFRDSSNSGWIGRANACCCLGTWIPLFECLFILTDTPPFPLGDDMPTVSVHEGHCSVNSLSPRHRDSSFLLLPPIGTDLSHANENQLWDSQLKLEGIQKSSSSY